MMDDVGHDLEALLRSPLDPAPEDAPRRWPLAVVLFLLGALGAGAAVAAYGGDETDAAAPQPTVAVEATREVIVTADPFPAGYVPIATDVAVRAESPLTVGERMLVPVTMVVRRDRDPGSVPRPLGGRWEMRTDAGVLASQRIVFDPFRPSIFSIEFPALEVAPSAVTLVERWDAAAAEGIIQFAWPGIPYRNEAPIRIELGQGVSLVITELELSNFLGRAAWQLEGTDFGVVELDVDLLDDTGAVFESYAAGGGSLDADAGTGTIDYFWLPGIRVDQDDAATLRLTARVMVGTPVATEIDVPVP